ncbi:hypothetical protein BD779DRAFT_226704 [Infundibulicybe gibba]|nr:hypothetical protein BD779DRAFT_226704 [Infundibulicybe gibba]
MILKSPCAWLLSLPWLLVVELSQCASDDIMTRQATLLRNLWVRPVFPGGCLFRFDGDGVQVTSTDNSAKNNLTTK